MSLLTLKEVARQLGYRSVQSVRDLAAAGHLTIIHLPTLPGRKRAKGPPRVSTTDVERLIRRCEAAAASPVAPASPPPQKPRPAGRRRPMRRPQPIVLRHYE